MNIGGVDVENAGSTARSKEEGNKVPVQAVSPAVFVCDYVVSVVRILRIYPHINYSILG